MISEHQTYTLDMKMHQRKLTPFLKLNTLETLMMMIQSLEA